MEGGLSEEVVEEAVEKMQVRTELTHVMQVRTELTHGASEDRVNTCETIRARTDPMLEMIMAWEGTGQALSCVDICAEV